MKQIGTIVRVQIQQNPLKDKNGSSRIYDPAPLTVVQAVRVTSTGLVGITIEGVELLDVHNESHPRSRYRGDNSISIGFTRHYDQMREYFGRPLADGIAGESLIVETDEAYLAEELNDLIIESGQTGEQIRLGGVRAIQPCAEFSQYAAGRNLHEGDLKDALQFLLNGRRGFYAQAQATGGTIHTGDRVYLAE